MEYYSAIKRNEVVIRDMTWINLENVMVKRKKLDIKDLYSVISFTEMFRIGKSTDTDSTLLFARG